MICLGLHRKSEHYSELFFQNYSLHGNTRTPVLSLQQRFETPSVKQGLLAVFGLELPPYPERLNLRTSFLCLMALDHTTDVSPLYCGYQTPDLSNINLSIFIITID